MDRGNAKQETSPPRVSPPRVFQSPQGWSPAGTGMYSRSGRMETRSYKTFTSATGARRPCVVSGATAPPAVPQRPPGPSFQRCGAKSELATRSLGQILHDQHRRGWSAPSCGLGGSSRLDSVPRTPSGLKQGFRPHLPRRTRVACTGEPDNPVSPEPCPVRVEWASKEGVSCGTD